MNESLMRDLHDTQMEELTTLKSTIAELAKKPTATPADIAKVQMMISNIKIPAQDNSQISEALRQLQTISQKIDRRNNSENEAMNQGARTLQAASDVIESKMVEFKFRNALTLLWAVGMTIFSAVSLYDQHSLMDQLSELRENSLKYRYIKMKGEASPKRIAEIEDLFVYNRNLDKILEMQDDVKAFEDAVAKKAIADEQARLQRLESERLNNEANMLKQK